MSRYLDPTNDSLFKKIFADVEKLKEFINAVLDLPPMYRIKEIEYIPFEQLPSIYKGKRSSFYLKVKDESGNWYIIEMQKKNESRRLSTFLMVYPDGCHQQQKESHCPHLQLSS